jgi:hypothetical protein
VETTKAKARAQMVKNLSFIFRRDCSTKASSSSRCLILSQLLNEINIPAFAKRRHFLEQARYNFSVIGGDILLLSQISR